MAMHAPEAIIANLVATSERNPNQNFRVMRILSVDEKHSNNIERLFSYICTVNYISVRSQVAAKLNGGEAGYFQQAISCAAALRQN